MANIEMTKQTLVPVSKLHPSVYNPRKISAKSFRQLKSSIRTYGFVKPIVVQKNGMNIVGGHQGLKAILDICKQDGTKVPKVPCMILDITDRKAQLLNIALNKINGEFDAGKLADLFRSMDDDQTLNSNELESVGYEMAAVQSLLATADKMMDEDDLSPFASSITLSVKFENAEERDTVKAILTERATEANLKPGTVLHTLLVEKKGKRRKKST